MKDYKIEIKKGVPMPPVEIKGRPKSQMRIVAEAMEVGDMVEVDVAIGHRMRAAMALVGHKPMSRSLPNGKMGIWRIE